jgi:hypothetical protein
MCSFVLAQLFKGPPIRLRCLAFVELHQNGYLKETAVKISELVNEWEQNATGRMAHAQYNLVLDLESAARLQALHEMYPKRSVEELLAELVGAALEELEGSFPYVKGQKVIATDELGDPLYEDVGPTPRFLELSKKHLHELNKLESSS